MKKTLLIIGLTVFITAMATNTSNLREKLEEFARTVIPSCTMTDGYQCVEVMEDDFLSEESIARLTPGPYLVAFNAAYKAFSELAELSIEQRHLKHYRIGFTESDDSYIILFMPLLLPQDIENNQPVGYATASFGKTIKFWIDKNSNQVTKHLFYK